MAQFWSKSENFSSKWWKNVRKFQEKYRYHIFVKNVTSFGKKTCCWCRINLKFCTPANYLGLKKTSQNNFFIWGQQHCENWIWNMHNFKHNLHAASLNCKWFVCKFACTVDCVQLVPKYILKVKLSREQSPNNCFWNNWVLRKWGVRYSF